MNIIIIAATVIVIITGVFYRQAVTGSQNDNSGPSPTPVSVTPAPENSPASTSTSVPSPKPTTAPEATKTPVTPTKASEQPQTGNTSIPNYPGASVAGQTGSATVLLTPDSPDTVTSWYETKIKAMGLNVRSFVKTKANDNVNNKLTGASQSTEITITITRSPGDANTRIEVSQ